MFFKQFFVLHLKSLKWDMPNTVDFQSFIEILESNYHKGLPGKIGQFPMKPYVGIDKKIDFPVSKNARKGAVLALFYPVEEITHLALMQRPVYEGIHGGQISFPGGKIEVYDKSPLTAALREAHEEIGIIPDMVQVLGPITEVFVLASNFLVYPFVGYVAERPNFVIDKREVETLLEIPFQTFFDPSIIKEKNIRSKAGFDLKAPYFDIDGRVLWGATAMMISELVELIRAKS